MQYILMHCGQVYYVVPIAQSTRTYPNHSLETVDLAGSCSFQSPQRQPAPLSTVPSGYASVRLQARYSLAQCPVPCPRLAVSFAPFRASLAASSKEASVSIRLTQIHSFLDFWVKHFHRRCHGLHVAAHYECHVGTHGSSDSDHSLVRGG